MYRCEATSVEGFIQQLAVSYVANGYWFYVTGEIPTHKDPKKTDDKIIRQYDLDISKWQRCRQKKRGIASVQYLRHGHFFVLIATHGRHKFMDAEAGALRDIRRVPIKFAGYSVGCKQAGGQWHPSVRIGRKAYRALRAEFFSAALQGRESLSARLRALPFAAYAPVRSQFLAVLRQVNRRRASASLEPVPASALRLERRSIVALKPVVCKR